MKVCALLRLPQLVLIFPFGSGIYVRFVLLFLLSCTGSSFEKCSLLDKSKFIYEMHFITRSLLN